MTERLVWIDCEMTGLDLVNDALVEVACLVTDADLNVLGTGVDVVIRTDPAKLDGMIDVVKEMHASSGLTDDIRAATTSMEDAEQQVLEYVKQWVPDRRKAPLCGNSIATDRAFLARDM
ncbi:MAG: oligoribonuclease, partial [Frankiales bacterium]|nr:oligoribonuclease [Frankiales bacterium]